MNKLILPIMALTFSTSIFADDHKSNKNTDKSRMDHPNQLLNQQAAMLRGTSPSGTPRRWATKH